MKVALFALSCLALALATPVKRQVANFAYQLPDGVELVVGSVKTSFTCDNRIYGYYADVDNACKVFHVCLPLRDDNDVVIETAHYSFFCGNTTVFDQEQLVCVHNFEDFDCNSAPNHYDKINQEFGRIPVN